MLYHEGNIDTDQTAAHPPLLEAAAGVTGQPGAHRSSENNAFKKQEQKAACSELFVIWFAHHCQPDGASHRAGGVLVLTPQRERKRPSGADEWESGWGLNVECADTVAGRGQRGGKQSERVRRINPAGFRRASSAAVTTGGRTARETGTHGIIRVIIISVGG